MPFLVRHYEICLPANHVTWTYFRFLNVPSRHECSLALAMRLA